jgi:hypothetical protein
MLSKGTGPRPLIVWSGGFDSTALVLDAFNKGETIDTCYVELTNNPQKTKMELKARDAISEILLKKRPYFIHRDYRSVVPYSRFTSGYPQPFFWIVHSVIVADSAHTEVRFGYINSDTIWHFRSEFINAFNSLYTLAKTHHDVLPPKVSFPLEFESKERIFDNYYQYLNCSDLSKEEMLTILDSIWFCENPRPNKEGNFTQCLADPSPGGYCNPCEKFKPLLSEIEKYLGAPSKSFLDSKICTVMRKEFRDDD